MGDREVGTLRIVRIALFFAVLAAALVGAGPAAAATTQQIYRDLADNNRLDGRYSKVELERAFSLPGVVRTDRVPAARKPIAVPAASEGAPPQSRAKRSDHRRIPFTALDAALLVAGGGPLLLIGVGLRRRLADPQARVPAASA